MLIQFTERNYEASTNLKEVVEKKLSKLDKYFEKGEMPTAKVNFKKESTTFKLEVMLDYFGKFVRAEEKGENFYDNIDKVLPKLEGQIRKYRTIFDKQQKNGAFKDEIVFEEKTPRKTGTVVRKKQFEMVPMTVEEAIAQMEMLDHTFFVFLEKESEEIKVLYLREDGELGLIEPII
ncbi:MAG: ribosome-associated translation inhibitor RaiA [Clostridiales bacterium]|nr:ribosome-associated translation inhibitor RaiA [Clostridiales bacterium]